MAPIPPSDGPSDHQMEEILSALAPVVPCRPSGAHAERWRFVWNGACRRPRPPRKTSIMSFYIDRRSSTAVARVDTDAPNRRDAPTSQPPGCEPSPARIAMGYAGSPAVPHRLCAQGSVHTSVGPTRRGESVLAVENYALVSKRQRGTIEAVEAMEGSGLRMASRLPHHVACPN